VETWIDNAVLGDAAGSAADSGLDGHGCETRCSHRDSGSRPGRGSVGGDRPLLFVLHLILLLFIPTLTPTLHAQDGRKTARAVRVSEGSIRVDGHLDDQAWREAPPITEFVQKEPAEGVRPTEEMDVRIVYDDGAIYIGARMHNRKQTPIQAPLGRRDAVNQAEYLLVHLDTFFDRRTAYAFGVTASGVRIDRYYPQDNEDNFDDGFDPVWEARTSVENQAWTAELWIPFSQLRFNDQGQQTWGLNLERSTPTLNEMDYWVAVPRTERVWASAFGDLRGIEGVRPTARIEVVPYVVQPAR
jgi:hypothetical protein